MRKYLYTDPVGWQIQDITKGDLLYPDHKSKSSFLLINIILTHFSNNFCNWLELLLLYQTQFEMSKKVAIYTLESLDGKPIKSISYYKSPKSLVIWLCWCHLLNTPLGQIYLNTPLIYLETTEARSSPITNITILIFRLFDIVWTMSKYGKYEPEKLRLWTLDALQKLFCGILLI